MTTLLPRASRALPSARRLQRLVLNGLTYPHGVDGYRDAYRPAASAGRIHATVEAIVPQTPRAHTLLLRPETPIAFAPGQHLLVTCQVDGARQTRCYSLCDTPRRDDGRLEITVAHIPDGLVSSHLAGGGRAGIRVGDAVGISAPQGSDFVLPLPRPERLLLIGGGSGVTPLRSMWRTMRAEGLGDRVTVLYYARTSTDALFLDELTDLPDAHVVPTREDGQDTGADGAPTGRFDPAHLTAIGIDPATTDAFACGPPGLIDAVRTAWATAPDRLRTESFAPPVAPVGDDMPEGMLTFARTGRSAHNDGATLLDQAEAAGLTPESGCRMGICHSCTTTKHAGAVRDIRTGEIDEREGCEVQLCISQPVGNVSLDL